MKRSVCAIMTAAAVGCQSQGPTVIHETPAGVGTPTAAAPARQTPPTADVGRTDPDVQQAGYGTGFGVISNQRYQQRVAAGLPSHGGAPPGYGPSFYDLVSMLAEPIPLYLGDMDLPDGQVVENLEMARLHIDMLDVLRQKTAGHPPQYRNGGRALTKGGTPARAAFAFWLTRCTIVDYTALRRCVESHPVRGPVLAWVEARKTMSRP